MFIHKTYLFFFSSISYIFLLFQIRKMIDCMKRIIQVTILPLYYPCFFMLPIFLSRFVHFCSYHLSLLFKQYTKSILFLISLISSHTILCLFLPSQFLFKIKHIGPSRPTFVGQLTYFLLSMINTKN